MTNTTTPTTNRIGRYIDMWSETEASTRMAIVDEVWTSDASSVDPLSAVSGRPAIDAMVASVQDSYPGHRFRQVGEALEHHDRLLFFWEMVDADGKVVLTGLDSVRLAEDGRFAELAGFFGPKPA